MSESFKFWINFLRVSFHVARRSNFILQNSLISRNKKWRQKDRDKKIECFDSETLELIFCTISNADLGGSKAVR